MALKRKCGWCGRPANRLPIGYVCPSCKEGTICEQGSLQYWAVEAAARKEESPKTIAQQAQYANCG